jgi:hypothetical protein
MPMSVRIAALSALSTQVRKTRDEPIGYTLRTRTNWCAAKRQKNLEPPAAVASLRATATPSMVR